MSREKSGGLSVTTLLIASASAAAAAIVVPLIWEGGGVLAAAITPIVVALTSEALKRPVEKVQTVGVWRRTPQGTAIRQRAGGAHQPYDPDEEYLEIEPERTDDPFGLREPERRPVLTRRRIALALATAGLAFAIAAVVVTASELAIFGDSVSRSSRTTFFGGEERKGKATPTPTPTPAADEEATATPAPTETAPPDAQATPAEPTPEGGERTAPEAPAPGATPPPASTP
jgi:hypothetical protein